METRKPAPLNALTGLRCFAAINIVLFHFSNPQWFGFLAPVVNAGFISVSYFILLSGFVLAYNYASGRGTANWTASASGRRASRASIPSTFSACC